MRSKFTFALCAKQNKINKQDIINERWYSSFEDKNDIISRTLSVNPNETGLLTSSYAPAGGPQPMETAIISEVLRRHTRAQSIPRRGIRLAAQLRYLSYSATKIKDPFVLRAQKDVARNKNTRILLKYCKYLILEEFQRLFEKPILFFHNGIDVHK